MLLHLWANFLICCLYSYVNKIILFFRKPNLFWESLIIHVFFCLLLIKGTFKLKLNCLWCTTNATGLDFEILKIPGDITKDRRKWSSNSEKLLTMNDIYFSPSRIRFVSSSLWVSSLNVFTQLCVEWICTDFVPPSKRQRGYLLFRSSSCTANMKCCGLISRQFSCDQSMDSENGNSVDIVLLKCQNQISLNLHTNV